MFQRLRSFPLQPATSCGAKFPVLNHTVGVEGLEGEIVVEGAPSSLVSVSLTSANISQLRLDMVVSVVITACTQLTCLSPRLPLVAGERESIVSPTVV